jgi:hypothetical protein
MNRAIQSGLIAAIFGVSGLGLGVLVLSEAQSSSAPVRTVTLDAKLRIALTNMQAMIKELKAEVTTLKNKAPIVGRRPPIVKPTSALSAPPPISDNASMAEVVARVKQLEDKLAISLRSVKDMSSEELQAMFAKAVDDEEGPKALEALRALARIKDYAAFTGCFGQMHEVEWLGLRGSERRGWGSTELYHFILTSSVLGVEGEAAKLLQVMALGGLRKAEDKAKAASTYAYFLTNLPTPEPRDSEVQVAGGDEGREGRRGRRRREKSKGKDKNRGPKDVEDLYRYALGQLARLKDSAVIEPLGQVLTNLKNPTDVRITAMRGLVKQEDPAAFGVIESVLADGDEKVRRQAEMILKVSDSPVTGYMVMKVNKESAAGKAGLVRGQVITAINGKKIKSGKDIDKIVKKTENGKSLSLTIFSNGATQNINVVKQGKKFGVSGRIVKEKKPQS